MSDKKSELRTAVSRYQTQLESPIGYCRRAANELYRNLADNHIDENSIEVVQGAFNGETGTAQHFFLAIDLAGETIIADATVHQFTYENYIENKAGTYIPDEKIPDVGWISSDDDIHDRYIDI